MGEFNFMSKKRFLEERKPIYFKMDIETKEKLDQMCQETKLSQGYIFKRAFNDLFIKYKNGELGL
jgi:predicted transcriptional regulator